MGLFGRNKEQESTSESHVAGQTAIERGDLQTAFEVFSRVANRGDAEGQCRLPACRRTTRRVQSSSRVPHNWETRTLSGHSECCTTRARVSRVTWTRQSTGSSRQRSAAMKTPRRISGLCRNFLARCNSRNSSEALIELGRDQRSNNQPGGRVPDLEEARSRLKAELASCQSRKVKAVKIIHGYGSSGVGGVLRHGIRKSLVSRRKEGLLRAVIFGENWSIFDSNARAVLQVCPDLAKDRDLCNSNPGISIVLF